MTSGIDALPNWMPLDRRPEVVEHRFHQRRVERVADAEALALLEAARDRLDLGLITGDDDRTRSVDRGDGHAAGEVRGDLVLGRLDRDHRATGRQCLHEAGAGGDQRARVIEAEHARDVRGGDLTDGVARQVVRGDVPRLDQPEQRDLDREDRGLRMAGLVEQAGVVAPHHVAQRPVELRVEVGADRVERVGEHRIPLVQLAAHAEALRALACEQERRAAARGLTAGDRRVGLVVAQRRQPAHQFVAAARDDHRTPLERRTCGGERSSQVDEVRVHVQKTTGHLLEGFVCARRHEHRHRRRVVHRFCRGTLSRRFSEYAGNWGDPRGPIRRRRRGLKHDVRVRAGEAERRDARAARMAGLGPLLLGGEEFDRTGRPVDLRRRLVDVQRAGQHPGAQRQHHLDDRRDTGRHLRVADVRLHRAEEQRAFAVLTVGREQGLRLDRVAESGAGAVAVDGVHFGRFQPRVRQGLADHALLRRAVGGGETVGGTVLVHRGAAHDRQHTMPVADGVGEAFQQDETDAFGEGHAVGGIGVGLAAPVTASAR